MHRFRWIPAAGLGLALAVVTAAPALAAHYKDRSVDGVTYSCSVHNDDYGTFRGLEVRFSGDHAGVTFPRGGRLELTLDDEEIIDPRAIGAYDPLRGIRWVISVDNLGRR